MRRGKILAITNTIIEANAMMLHGIGIAGYRSFGPIVQRIGPFSERLNIFIGSNNSGKSNILRVLFTQLKNMQQNAAANSFGAHDGHKGNGQEILTLSLGVPRTNEFWRHGLHLKTEKEAESAVRLLDRTEFNYETELAWFDKVWHIAQNKTSRFPNPDSVSNFNNDRSWERLKQYKRPDATYDSIDQRNSVILDDMHNVAWGAEYPAIEYIPDFRKLTENTSERNGFGGSGLVKDLARYYRPDINNLDRKGIFASIQRFVRQVTGASDAELSLPHSNDAIYIHMNGRTLQLESLGTGIHQVVILATAATLIQDKIVCLEEPEIYLHPVLQRQLLHYLATETKNQYFISSHSAHILDTEAASVFHTELVDGCTVCRSAINNRDKWRICRDLGYRPSDILQTNCVVWVEGPSDVIYLRHWLKAKDQQLKEGVHFSFMFYGGKLLSHLSIEGQEESVSEFLSLTWLNRHPAIVLDSDRDTEKDSINDTKSRILEEFAIHHAFAWVTAGREVENYIPNNLLVEAVDSVKSDHGQYVQSGQFSKVLPHVRLKNGQVGKPVVDKVRVAHAVSAKAADLTPLDLEERIGQLIAYIRSANHFPTP